MTVDFKFDIDQKVKTVLGQNGIITNASLDNTKCIQYYVLLENGNGTWLKEDQIEAA